VDSARRKGKSPDQAPENKEVKYFYFF